MQASLPVSDPTGSPRSGATPGFLSSFDVSGPYAIVMRISLALALVSGLGLGLLLVAVAGLRLPWAIPWPQLSQGHGQVQALGFTLLFIVSVGLQLFPRFLSAPLTHAERATRGAAILAVSLLLRLIAQPLEPSALRSGLLVLVAIGVPVGALYAGSAFHGLSKRSVQPRHGPAAAWRRFIAVAGLSLGTSLLLHTWVALELAAGAVLARPGPNEALIHLELTGVAAGFVFAVASRVLGRLLLLQTRPALNAAVPRLAAGYALGLALVVAGWLLGGPEGAWVRLAGSAIELGVLLSWLWLVGLYDRPSRASGIPHVTVPTRRWVRMAFAFFLFGLTASTILFAREALLGVPAGGTELSAVRHALAQGFLLTLMVAMGVRLLPGISVLAVKRRWLPELMVDLVVAGALLRVAAELLGGYAGLAGPLVALGGMVSFVGFTLFAVVLWSSLDQHPRPLPMTNP